MLALYVCPLYIYILHFNPTMQPRPEIVFCITTFLSVHPVFVSRLELEFFPVAITTQSLGAELGIISISSIATLGLSDSWQVSIVETSDGR